MTMAYLHLGLSDIATLQFTIAVCRATLPSLASRIPGISVSFMSKGMGACLTTTFRLVADSKATQLHEKLGIGTSYCPMLSRTTLTPRLPSPANLLTTPAFAKNRLNNLFPCIRRIDMDSCVCVLPWNWQFYRPELRDTWVGRSSPRPSKNRTRHV